MSIDTPNPDGTPSPATKKTSTLGVVAFILAVLGFLIGVVPFVALIFGLPGLVLGLIVSVALIFVLPGLVLGLIALFKKGVAKGLAIAAVVLASIALLTNVIVGGVVLFAGTPSLTAIADSGGGNLYDSGKLTTPSVADASGGILVNKDGTVGGTPAAGSVRVDIYVDLMCPVCHQFETLNADTLSALRQNGTVALYYHPVSILDRSSSGTHYSTRAASALATVAQYDPTHFLAFFNALFDSQPVENTTGLSNATIVTIATGVGVPDAVTAKFKDGEFTRWVTAATEKASVDGLQYTPWIRAEQTAELDSGIWSNTANLKIVLQYIHDFGLQKYLDSVAAA